MVGLRIAVEAARFATEVAAVVTLVIVGSRASPVLAVALPLALVLTWGAFVAPKAMRRLRDPARIGLELVLFAGVGIVAVLADAAVLGVVVGGAGAALSVAMRAVGSQA